MLASDVRLFVFSSSCATYGVPQRLPVEESSPKDPINPYGVTKLFLEQVLSAYRYSHGLQHVCLRYFNAAGAHPSGEIGEYHDPETHLIPLALKAVLGTAPALKVFGKDLPTPDGTCIRDFVHVSDLGRAHVKALDYLASGGESIALNLGAGRGTSIGCLLDAVKKSLAERYRTSLPPAGGEIPPRSMRTPASRAGCLAGHLNLIWNLSCAPPGNGRPKAYRVCFQLLAADRFVRRTKGSAGDGCNGRYSSEHMPFLVSQPPNSSCKLCIAWMADPPVSSSRQMQQVWSNEPSFAYWKCTTRVRLGTLAAT